MKGGRASCFAAVCFDLAASRSWGSPSGPWAERMEPALLLPLVKTLTSLFLQVIQWVCCHHQINLRSSPWTIHSLSSPLCQVPTLPSCPLTSLGPMTFILESVSSLPSFPALSLFVIVPGYFPLSQSGHLNSPHLILFWLLPFLLLLASTCFRLLFLTAHLLCHSFPPPAPGSALSNGNPGISLTGKGDHNRRLKKNKCHEK